jgi:NAD+ synthase
MSKPIDPAATRGEAQDHRAGVPPGLLLNAPLARAIITRFIADGVRRPGFESVVLGLSGGIDSSLTSALAAEALGPARVLAVALPYRTSSAESLALAEDAARAGGLRFEIVPITAMAEPYLATIPAGDRVRRGNVLARLRMVVLYDLSARERGLVLGTSNKTELLLGYSTQHGDSACALMPIGDLYKTQVRALARHMGVAGEILARPPSADLWQGQTDEAELGFSYEDVDRLLARMVDDRIGPARILEEGFDPALVRRVREMIRRSQYKRRLPPIAKISARTVGIDFRYPRDWDGWGGD